MTNFNVTILEGDGGYLSTAYTGSGYVIAGTTIEEVLAGNHGAVRALSQTVTLTDAIKLGIHRKITQAITIVGAMARGLIAFRTILAGAGGYEISGYTSSGYATKVQVTINDDLAKVRDTPRTLSDQITTTDAVVRIYDAIRTIVQAVTAPDTLNRTYGAMRTLTEAGTFTDAVARKLDALRVLTQTITLTTLLVVFVGAAGTGARRIWDITSHLYKRIGTTRLFRRTANTRA